MSWAVFAHLGPCVTGPVTVGRQGGPTVIKITNETENIHLLLFVYFFDRVRDFCHHDICKHKNSAKL